MRYIILTAGRTGGAEFDTLPKARKELSAMRQEDRKACKAKYGQAKVTAWKDGYKVEFGANLWSGASIQSNY
jgi:hypothetical protein